jgi:hypothetical protein
MLISARAEGEDFETAWGRARRRGAVRYPHDTPERRAWREALDFARPEFEAAYEGRPTTISLAFESFSTAPEEPARPEVGAANRGDAVQLYSDWRGASAA